MVNITESTDGDLDKVKMCDSNTMRVYLPSDIIYHTDRNSSLLQHVSAVTQAGNFKKLRIGQRDGNRPK